MCEGLQQAGSNTILIGRKSTKIRENQTDVRPDLFKYYGIETPFAIRLFRFPPFQKVPKPLRFLWFFVFALYALVKAKGEKPDLIYTRDPYTALLATALKMPLILEEHAPPLRRSQFLLRRLFYGSKQHSATVFISQALKDIYERMGLLAICRSPGVVAHDAAAQSQICARPQKQKQSGLSKLRVGYVGSLLPGRGIEMILEVARTLPDLAFWIVGGKHHEIRSLAPTATANVVWRGFVSPGKLTQEYAELDILLMPYQENTSTHGGVLSARWMSPLKMFEYMASGVSLIASDLPVLREVLVSQFNCLLASPAIMGEWASAIQRLAESPEMRFQLASNARTAVINRYNWQNRARRVLEAVNCQMVKS